MQEWLSFPSEFTLLCHTCASHQSLSFAQYCACNTLPHEPWGGMPSTCDLLPHSTHSVGFFGVPQVGFFSEDPFLCRSLLGCFIESASNFKTSRSIGNFSLTVVNTPSTTETNSGFSWPVASHCLIHQHQQKPGLSPIYLNKAGTWARSGVWAITGTHNYKEHLALVLNQRGIEGRSLDPPHLMQSHKTKRGLHLQCQLIRVKKVGRSTCFKCFMTL